MRIFYRCTPKTDGECCIIGSIYKDDVLPASREEQLNGALVSHGETVYCKTDHEHEKACAVPLIDTIRPAMEKYFVAWDTTPEDPTPVSMPKKEIEIVEDGETKTVEVDDHDLTAIDLDVASFKAAEAVATESKTEISKG